MKEKENRILITASDMYDIKVMIPVKFKIGDKLYNAYVDSHIDIDSVEEIK